MHTSTLQVGSTTILLKPFQRPSQLALADSHCPHAGCRVDETPPTQGDIRLVPLTGMNFASPTSPCDEVHFGGVEIYNDGDWGRICRTGRRSSGFVVEALVICKQLGFPFGGLMDVLEVNVRGPNGRASEEGPFRDSGAQNTTASKLVWATEMQCTGLEDRLEDCFFPEAFGSNPIPRRPRRANAQASPGPDTKGIADAACSQDDGSTLAVVCRQFEIEGVYSTALARVHGLTFAAAQKCIKSISQHLVSTQSLQSNLHLDHNQNRFN